MGYSELYLFQVGLEGFLWVLVVSSGFSWVLVGSIRF